MVTTLHRFLTARRWSANSQLDGSPTAQTQYGSAGERIFLEVAPQRTACNHPLIKDFQCLRVREIRYGDNGVKTSTGEWENFYSEIEGYKHHAWPWGRRIWNNLLAMLSPVL